MYESSHLTLNKKARKHVAHIVDPFPYQSEAAGKTDLHIKDNIITKTPLSILLHFLSHLCAICTCKMYFKGRKNTTCANENLHCQKNRAQNVAFVMLE